MHDSRGHHAARHCKARRLPPYAATTGSGRPRVTPHDDSTGDGATGGLSVLPRVGAVTGNHQRPGTPQHGAVSQLPSTAPAATHAGSHSDRGRGWLKGAMLALAVLAVAAAVVSWDAQYVLVRSARHNPAVAALEAGIPDI